MNKNESTNSIVAGGGWENGTNTEFKESVSQYGFSFYLRLECYVLVGLALLTLIIFLLDKEASPSLTIALVTFLVLSQPIIFYKLIKSYGKKTITEKVKRLNFGESTRTEKVDPYNLY